MLKLVNKKSGLEEYFLYSKFVPRIGEIIFKGGKYYRVNNIIYDDDEGDIIVEVLLDTERTSAEELFKNVPKDIMDRIKGLVLSGSKLFAVKLLCEVSGVGVKEAREYCDSFTN